MNDFTSRKLLDILSEMAREMAKIRRALEEANRSDFQRVVEEMARHGNDIQRNSGGDTEPESHHGDN